MSTKYLLSFILIIALLSACSPITNLPTTSNISGEDISNDYSNDNRLTLTGFYWPTGKNPIILQEWLSSGCDGKKDYFIGEYHIGVDIDADLDEKVFAIADGEVFHISENGWGTTNQTSNKGILIKHYLRDGTPFIAVYGHVQSDLQKNNKIKAGEIIGTVGEWKDGDHLHLSIFPGDNAKGNLGKMTCSTTGASLDPNGTVDPMKWLTTQYPSNYLEGEVLGVSVTPTNVSTSTSSQEDKLDYVRVGSFPPSDWMLTYDVNLWNPTTNLEIPDRPYQLELKSDPACIISQNIGRGAPETWKRSTVQETIGDNIFSVEQWTDITTRKIILTVFFYDQVEIAVKIGQNPDICLDSAKMVLKYSVENSFGPIKP